MYRLTKQGTTIAKHTSKEKLELIQENLSKNDSSTYEIKKIPAEELKIAVDVDGVLAFFYKSFCDTLKLDYVEPVDNWQLDVISSNFKHIASDLHFWNNIKLLSKPEDINFDITCYISSCPNIAYSPRQDWLEKNKFPEAPLIISNKKVEIMKRFDLDVLIDDKPLTVKKVNEEGLIGVQFYPYYANYEKVTDKVITNLNQLKEIL